MERELLQEVRQDVKDLKEIVTKMQIASARRDGRLYVVMAIFGMVGGAVMDIIRRKILG